MKSFTSHTGIVMPLDRSNVDTDMIIPKQFMKSISRKGFGKNLFDSLRYLDEGIPNQPCEGRPVNKDFEINFPRYENASVLLTRDNFGCGSSREHAPWALEDFGFRVIIATSFADIFYNNAFKNGILLITLPVTIIDQLFAEVASQQGYTLDVDLNERTITTPSGQEVTFEIEAFKRRCLLEGLDEIGLTLRYSPDIEAFENVHMSRAPWVFDVIQSSGSDGKTITAAG